MQKFHAYRTFQENDAIVSRFVEMGVDELDPGDVVVRTKYSTINYKDALSYNGAGKIMRKYPTNAGIDMSGTVETSGDTRWKRGDKVIVHAYDVGVSHDGGYSEYIRVPGDWIVRRPESMTAFDAMTLGTAGFTAAQAIMLMEHNGLKPENGPVAVTGATGGVGSVAIEILAKTGYEVVAITGKKEGASYLKALGAKEVLQRQAIELSKIRPLDKSTWAGAIDNLGGDMLAASPTAPTTPLPFDVARSQLRMSPPRLSIAPDHVAFSSGRIFVTSIDWRSITSFAPSALR